MYSGECFSCVLAEDSNSSEFSVKHLPYFVKVLEGKIKFSCSIKYCKAVEEGTVDTLYWVFYLYFIVLVWFWYSLIEGGLESLDWMFWEMHAQKKNRQVNVVLCFCL